MIALPQSLPHVIWTNNRLVPLSEGWLAESLALSAAEAGMPEWELAPEVARAIAAFLQEEWCPPSLEAAYVQEMMRRSLEGIGFEKIAEVSRLVPPRVSISLYEIALSAPYELHFYNLLKERLTEAFDVNVLGVRLEELRACTKHLDAARRWKSTCARIHDDIILYCRGFLEVHPFRHVEMVIR